jgi:hypothetical protein
MTRTILCQNSHQNSDSFWKLQVELCSAKAPWHGGVRRPPFPPPCLVGQRKGLKGQLWVTFSLLVQRKRQAFWHYHSIFTLKTSLWMKVSARDDNTLHLGTKYSISVSSSENHYILRFIGNCRCVLTPYKTMPDRFSTFVHWFTC